MRIAFVTYGSIEQVSGGFIYDRALLRALAARGHLIDVVSLPWRAYGAAAAGSALTRARGRRAGADPRAYDAVIEDELVHPSLFARPAARHRRGGPPRIALVHNLRSARSGGRASKAHEILGAIERRYLATLDGAITVCMRTRSDVDALTEVPLHVLVAYPGRDHVAPDVGDATIERRARERGPLRVLHVAAVRPHKGLARLLAALARAAREGGLDFTLDVAGAPPAGAYARAIARAIAAHGCAARVRLHGELRGEALSALFRRAQIFALPSDREAYSLACLEALGHGLPVLATSAGGLAEMITNGREGSLIAPEETHAWAARLTELGADRARVAAMGLAARARYREHATWAEVAERVEAFISARTQARMAER